jgi:hypothetical protein
MGIPIVRKVKIKFLFKYFLPLQYFTMDYFAQKFIARTFVVESASVPFQKGKIYKEKTPLKWANQAIGGVVIDISYDLGGGDRRCMRFSVRETTPGREGLIFDYVIYSFVHHNFGVAHSLCSLEKWVQRKKWGDKMGGCTCAYH